MNGKQRAQQIESRRQLNWDHSDAEISKRARSVLRWKIRYDSIRVTAEKGQVTLLGEVNWDLDREAAEQTVRKLSGVVSVTNLLTVCAVRHARGPDRLPEDLRSATLSSTLLATLVTLEIEGDAKALTRSSTGRRIGRATASSSLTFDEV
jgi:osmotically-inducible protein OsmY